MTFDPLDTLAGRDRPVAPRAEFAAQLREQLLADLDLGPSTDVTSTGTAPTDTAPTDTAPTDMTSKDMTMSSQSPAPTAPVTITTSLSPYLIVDDGHAALEFYQRALGAVVTLSLDQPDGRLGHAELSIDGARFSIADEFPEYDFLGPKALGNTPVALDLVVPDVDEVFDRAIAAGATAFRPVAAQFYGSRSGQILDPFGHRWTISTPGEVVSPEEMQRRNDEMYRDDA